MMWDLSNPFVIDIEVAADDIDGPGHANNAVYVSWLERSAWRHSQFPWLIRRVPPFDRAGPCCVMKSDYLASAYARASSCKWPPDCRVRLKA